MRKFVWTTVYVKPRKYAWNSGYFFSCAFCFGLDRSPQSICQQIVNICWYNHIFCLVKNFDHLLIISFELQTKFNVAILIYTILIYLCICNQFSLVIKIDMQTIWTEPDMGRVHESKGTWGRKGSGKSKWKIKPKRKERRKNWRDNKSLNFLGIDSSRKIIWGYVTIKGYLWGRWSITLHVKGYIVI